MKHRFLGLMAALVFSIVGTSGMTDNAKTYVCSPMQGVLVGVGGTPLANVRVTRSWAWKRKKGEDTVKTDGQGRFSFEAVEAKRGFLGRLPAEQAVTQQFTAQGQMSGQPFLILTPRTGPLNHENQGQPIDVTCDMSAEPAHGGFWYGTCALNN